MERHPERPRRLLVITYHFPPDGSVGGLRWGGLSRHLARRGWEVQVITAAAQSADASVPGVQVHVCAVSRTLNDAYNQWAAKVRAWGGRPSPSTQPAAASPATEAPDAPARHGLVNAVRRNLATALAFPDYGRGWILPAARTARALLRAQTFDAVVTSGPPHSAHLAGLLACAGRRELHWVDMRDPWSSMIGKKWAQSAFRSEWVRFLIPRLERLVFRRAAHVVTNTAEYAAELRETFPAMRVSFIPNGIDRDRLPPPPADRFGGLSIAHAGSLYAGRDLTPVLRAMQAFLLASPEARSALMLRLAGNMDAVHSAHFRREVAAAGLESCVEVLGRVSSADALTLINRSHLALVLAQDQPMQVPAKLYECVAMGVPTLVIAESDSAAAREARRIGGMACDAADVAGIRDVLSRLWRDRTPAPAVGAPIGYDDIAAQMDALLRGAPDASDDDRRFTSSPFRHREHVNR
jgi:glycosyltransferase involved in cell wall biosynthesis